VKLSEAMMLGAMSHKMDGETWRTCLLGVSALALGAKSNSFNKEAMDRWPWIMEDRPVPEKWWPRCGTGAFIGAISELAAEVAAGRIPLEEVVDWVRSVEPQEPAQEPTAGMEAEKIHVVEVG
jgi:hypothetical protein